MLKFFYSLCIVSLVFCLLYLFSGGNVTSITRASYGQGSSSSPKVSKLGYVMTGHGHRSPPRGDRDRVSKLGYVMATHFSDQLTGSVANLMSLQCWASTLGPGVRVVEPFLRRSLLGINLNAIGMDRSDIDPDDDNSVRLSDIMDGGQWNNITNRLNLSSLVTWKDLIHKAPRKLIAVYKPPCRKTAHYGIQFENNNFYLSSARFAQEYGFEMIRNVSLPCQVFQTGEFQKLVYGDYNPRDVVVIFNLWGGVTRWGVHYRVTIPDAEMKQCNRDHFYASVLPSSGVIEDSNKYVNRYLSGGNYISVMVRFEHLILRHKLLQVSEAKKDFIVRQCFQSLLKHLHKANYSLRAHSIFLTMDSRKSGAQQFRNRGNQVYKSIATEAMDRLFPMLYGNSTTLEEWDRSFEDVASHNVPGYIAMLQKHLAAKGACLLTVGGGMFQQKTRKLHSTYHPNSPNCAYLVPGC